MKCRDFKNEFEERSNLSQMATLHLDSCANCQKLHFEQTRLWEMLGGLNRVEAPKDFNFQLKAKIARAKPGDYQTVFFPALRYVLPLSAVLVLLSVVALSGLYFVDRNSGSSVAVSQTPNLTANVSLPSNSFTNTNINEIADEKNSTIEDITLSGSTNKELIISNKKEGVSKKNGGSKALPTSKPEIISSPVNDSSGDSRDIAGTNPKVLTPQDFNTNRVVQQPVNPNFATKIEVKDLLKTFGIVTDSLKIISVEKNSFADRSGVKSGDIIELIDGKKVSGNVLQGKQITIKTITVLRQGERQEIILQNR